MHIVENQRPGFYVVRTLSHTDRQCTWKVMSRCFPTSPNIDIAKLGLTPEQFRERMRLSAESWCDSMRNDWHRTLKRRPKVVPNFFVVEVK